MIALFWILIALVSLDIVLHLQHLTDMAQLHHDVAQLRSRTRAGDAP